MVSCTFAQFLLFCFSTLISVPVIALHSAPVVSLPPARKLKDHDCQKPTVVNSCVLKTTQVCSETERVKK